MTRTVFTVAQCVCGGGWAWLVFKAVSTLYSSDCRVVDEWTVWEREWLIKALSTLYGGGCPMLHRQIVWERLGGLCLRLCLLPVSVASLWLMVVLETSSGAPGSWTSNSVLSWAGRTKMCFQCGLKIADKAASQIPICHRRVWFLFPNFVND